MSSEPVLVSADERGVATVTLNRPEVHNAFDDAVIALLAETFAALGADRSVRLVVLAAAGASFSAGADLEWMRRMAAYSREENLADATQLARMLERLARLPRPTVAAVQGSAFGGGVGLVACCDFAIAVDTAKFSFSEARLGLIPATISPFVIAAIGARAARRLFLTAERFDAALAERLGLVSEVVPAGELGDAVERLAASLVAHGPGTTAATKALVDAVAGRAIDDALLAECAERIAERRVSPEGREGIAAFLEKRRPKWPET